MHTHTHACVHTHRARYLASSTCPPRPPAPAQLCWRSHQAAVRRLQGQRVPGAVPHLLPPLAGAALSGRRLPTPTAGTSVTTWGHSPRRAAGGPAPPQRGAQETEPALRPRETDNKREKTQRGRLRRVPRGRKPRRRGEQAAFGQELRAVREGPVELRRGQLGARGKGQAEEAPRAGGRRPGRKRGVAAATGPSCGPG